MAVADGDVVGGCNIDDCVGAVVNGELKAAEVEPDGTVVRLSLEGADGLIAETLLEVEEVEAVTPGDDVLEEMGLGVDCVEGVLLDVTGEETVVC